MPSRGVQSPTLCQTCQGFYPCEGVLAWWPGMPSAMQPEHDREEASGPMLKTDLDHTIGNMVVFRKTGSLQ